MQEPTISVRLTADKLERLERMVQTARARRTWGTVTRHAVLRWMIDRGIERFERELRREGSRELDE